MALIFMDGFDMYAARADFAGSQIATPNNATETAWTISTGRDGNTALYCGNFGGQFLTVPCAAARGTTVIFSFSFLPQNAGLPDDNIILSLRTNGLTPTNLMSLSLTGDNLLFLTPNSGSLIYAPPNALMPRVWNYIELSVTLGTGAANGAVELRVNGVTVASASGIDTFVDSTSDLGYLRFTSDSTQYAIDDLVIFTTAGSAPTTFLGDGIIRTLFPTADGAVVDWTANTGTDWQAVDETGSQDGDTTYIASSTVGQKSRFALQDLPNAVATIYAVQPRSVAKKSDAGERTFRTYLRSSASEANGTTRGLPATYSMFRGGLFLTDPNGGGAWSKAAIDAMELGVEVVA